MSAPPHGTRWKREDFAHPADKLARGLLGQRLVRILRGQRLSGLIVETEAYLGPHDRASHAAGGRRTARNESMYGPPGLAYVYFTYGMHHCFDVVGGEVGHPAAVLVRAIEPTEGIERMRSLRFGRNAREASDRQLASGPGKLCQALDIDRALDGTDLVTSQDVWIEREPSLARPPRRGPRIGLGEVGAWKHRRLRFWIRDSIWVSR